MIQSVNSFVLSFLKIIISAIWHLSRKVEGLGPLKPWQPTFKFRPEKFGVEIGKPVLNPISFSRKKISRKIYLNPSAYLTEGFFVL